MSRKTMLNNDTTWILPFGEQAELEMQSDWGNLTLVPVGAGEPTRLELSRGSVETVAVHIEKVDEKVRVSLDPQRGVNLFGGWECRATLFVPRNVHAHVQTNAGSVSVHDLQECALGIKASAGKIELHNVFGVIHLSADAGSVTGRDVGGVFDVETRAGSVRLEIADLQPAEHRIRATMGSVRIRLARGLDVAIETHTSMGSIRNSYPSRQGAATRMLLSTEMGSVRVEEGGSDAGRRWMSPAAPSTPSTPPTPPPPRQEKHADPELDRILKMVEDGALSAHDADELLRAMGRV